MSGLNGQVAQLHAQAAKKRVLELAETEKIVKARLKKQENVLKLDVQSQQQFGVLGNGKI